jgi:ankyrin repeat protein
MDRANGIVIARLLLDAGATVDVANSFGPTPIYYAIRNKYVDIVRLLIDRGASVSNINLGKYVPIIPPDWLSTFLASRSRCRAVAIIIVGIHKYHRTSIAGKNDINVLKLISKHIWSTRMDDVWSPLPQ